MNKIHHFSNFDFSPQFHAVLFIRDYLHIFTTCVLRTLNSIYHTHFSNFDFSPPTQQFHAVLFIRDYLHVFTTCVLRTLASIYHTHFSNADFSPPTQQFHAVLFIRDYLYGLCVFLAYTTFNLPHNVFFPICCLTCNSSQSSLFWQSSLRPLCLPCVHTPQFTTHNLFPNFFFVPAISCGPLYFAFSFTACVFLTYTSVTLPHTFIFPPIFSILFFLTCDFMRSSLFLHSSLRLVSSMRTLLSIYYTHFFPFFFRTCDFMRSSLFLRLSLRLVSSLRTLPSIFRACPTIWSAPFCS